MHRRGCSITGLSVRLPDRRSPAEFWQVLQDGRSFGGGLSQARRELVDPGTRTRWGAAEQVRATFLADIDCFDAALFGLSPTAAMFADPRQRLLMEATYAAIEDAGLSRTQLAGQRVGVFVAHDGFYLGAYAKRIPPEQTLSQEFIIPGNTPSFLANRLSSVFDFAGPSMVFDSTCSGHYVAMHHACQALQAGECDYAVVAAVTLFLDPWKDGETAATPFESTAAQVASFSRRASGYRTAEGCGAFIVERWSPERELHRSSYCIVRGSGYNSGGKTPSFAHPSHCQAVSLFHDVLAAAALPPSAINYIEAHGIGSLVGDAVEARALIDVFQRGAADPPCYVSTIKPNLGHSHAASGVYSLFKVIQCLTYGKIPPIAGLPAGELNEEIPTDTKGLEFLPQKRSWPVPREAGSPRRAFLNSYGMSNVNAALLIEEPPRRAAEPAAPQTGSRGSPPALICLSARSWSQVVVQLEQLLAFLQQPAADQPELPSQQDLAYTLQVGREAMSHRFATVVSSVAELQERLAAVLLGDRAALLTGHAVPGTYAAVATDLTAAAGEDAPSGLSCGRTADAGALASLAARWVSGAQVSWTLLYNEPQPRRVHLPTYPFARRRYWIPAVADHGQGTTPSDCRGHHPLLHSHTVEQSTHRFGCALTGHEFFLADHMIQGQRILPGVVHLEMARAATWLAAGQCADQDARVCLQDIVWARPLLVDGAGKRASIELRGEGADRFHFQISTAAESVGSAPVLHSQGVAALEIIAAPPPLDLNRLRAEMNVATLDGVEIYDLPPQLGLYLGPRLQGARCVYIGHQQILGRLSLPADLAAAVTAPLVLNPALMDPILQLAYLALVGRAQERMNLTIPFSLRRIEVVAPCTATMWVHIRYAAGSQPGDAVEHLDMDLCDDSGCVRVTMRGFSFRALGTLGHFRSDGQLAAVAALPSSLPASRPDEVLGYLVRLVAAVLHLRPEQIRPDEPLTSLGIDSVVVVRLTSELEKVFGTLPKTLFFEFRNLGQLAEHLVPLATARLPAQLAATASSPPQCDLPAGPDCDVGMTQAGARPATATPAAWPVEGTPKRADIAIIGLAGCYPQAANLEELWQNLRDGRDCITEVPRERWDWREYYTADRTKPGHHYSKWGGFISDADKFDPLFFGISPKEAEFMDPQERLFLQCVWAALEDSGYPPEALHRGTNAPRVGVYAGVMYGEYQLFGAEESVRGNRLGFASTPASIANRVSYALDLHGPSMTIDSQCSSSLTAIHLACQDLQLGMTEAAVAGGVNLSLHPSKYLELSRRQFISSKGRCESFGQGGDGYVPGEGVGVVFLKRLCDAERDGDHIYGVIRASAINHGGKTNGYTVPDPNAQRSVIEQALVQAGVNPQAISYVEAHGTGTALGDPIEIAGLTRAFSPAGSPPGESACWIGSVKSNIGHCEAAAGIAGLTKVLLQLRHGQIVPSLHSQVLNPHIDFAATPFKVCQELQEWHGRTLIEDGKARKYPRLAGISSFGAGGANAHLVVQEYCAPSPAAAPTSAAAQPAVILLSARGPERLREVAGRLLGFIRKSSAESAAGSPPGEGSAVGGSVPCLADLEYTLQVGRRPFEDRLALSVRSIEELAAQLELYVTGAPIEHCYFGTANRERTATPQSPPSESRSCLPEHALTTVDVAELMQRWVAGQNVSWPSRDGALPPRRVSLPTYPFAKERCWYPQNNRHDEGDRPPTARGGLQELHPLLQRNTSDLSEQRFSSHFTGEEFFLAAHLVNGKRVLPAVAILEMARAALELASARPAGSNVRLRNVVWTRPVVVEEDGQELHLRLHTAARAQAGANAVAAAPNIAEAISYELYASAPEETARAVVYSSGSVSFAAATQLPPLELATLRAALQRDGLAPERCYERLRALGINHGPGLRGLREVFVGDDQVLARLVLSPPPTDPSGSASARAASGYVLHPELLDSALQTVVALHHDLGLPFYLHELEVLRPCASTMWVWVRSVPAPQAADHTRCVDLDLCDEQGEVAVRLSGLRFGSRRQLPDGEPVPACHGALLARPVWTPLPAPAGLAARPVAEQLVVLCETACVPAELSAQLPVTTCLAWQSPAEERGARFIDYARRVLDLLQRNRQERRRAVSETAADAPRAPHTLLQLVVPQRDDDSELVGLIGMLRCAHLEDPGFVGQLVVMSAHWTPSILAQQLHRCRASARDLIRCDVEHQDLLSMSWHTLAPNPHPALPPWKESGVYLITGGLGGLGLLFALDVLAKTAHAKVMLVGRSAASAEALMQLRSLAGAAPRSFYQQVDITDSAAVSALVQQVLAQHGSINGIIHGAGVLADALLSQKTEADLCAVLAPKVAGALNLDAATRELPLDFFVLFSSLAGTLGNIGQADYATGNAFLDQFASSRNARLRSTARSGHTLSIGWPLWQDGGMQMPEASKQRLAARYGLTAIPTATAMATFYEAVQSQESHVLVLHGDLSRLRQLLPGAPSQTSEKPMPMSESPARPLDSPTLEEQLGEHLRQLLSGALKLPAQRIRSDVTFGEYGLDSVSAVELTGTLATTFGPLSKALFFEHETIAELSAFLCRSYPDVLRRLFSVPAAAFSSAGPAADVLPARPAVAEPFTKLPEPSPPSFVSAPASCGPCPLNIAIIGVSGRYPQARTVNELWNHLRTARDCISEVPSERWPWQRFYSPDGGAGRHVSKWGGFLPGVDEFDASFFGMSAEQASAMDPQERLFLQEVWAAFEDAGYTRETVGCASGDPERRIGVYAGVMYNEYQLGDATSDVPGSADARLGSLAGIANRTSQVFDLRGPSMVVETMCSSSLSAIHLACLDLRHGQINLGIAGGVNLNLHPAKYAMLSAAKLLSSQAQCRSFGAGSDGYVPGEGVGVVLLKRLEDAERDGDHIHGVIKGSAINHGGRANGYFVPSPHGQRLAIERALQEARLSACEVSYLEAHGTGTSLGDAIELSALAQAFGALSAREQPCLLGSAKSNIGHCEAAAGVAALTKVLLQLRHGQIAPSLYATPANANIDFSKTPFRVSTELQPWPRPRVGGSDGPRVAGISAFGAGGSNAHLIVAEYNGVHRNLESPPAEPRFPDTRALIPLSARTAPQLREVAANLLSFVHGALSPEDPAVGTGQQLPTIAELAYTLQVGREPGTERLGILAHSLSELAAGLTAFLAGSADGVTVFAGTANAATELAGFADEEELREAIELWLEKGKLPRLLKLWVHGCAIDWTRLYPGQRPRRVSLPTYPFARQRHRRGGPVPTPLSPAPAMLQLGGVPSSPPLLDEPLGGAASNPAALPVQVERLVLALLNNSLGAGVQRLTLTTEFATIPLESMHVAGFVSLWQATVKRSIPAIALYQTRTPRELADYILTNQLVCTADLLLALDRPQPPPAAQPALALSAMQQAFLVGRKLKTYEHRISSTIYVELEVREVLSGEKLAAAWNRLLNHHAALRVHFTDDFRQTVRPVVPPYTLRQDDLSALAPVAQAAALETRRQKMAFQEFDLERWPYCELHLSILAEAHCVVHLAIDELIADAYSVQLLIGQLTALCRDPKSSLPRLEYSYERYMGDLLAQEDERQSRGSRDYWQRKLNPLPPAPQFTAAELPCATDSPVRVLTGTLQRELWQAIKTRASQLHCYPSAFLLTLFSDVLLEHAGKPELRLGVTKLGRLARHADVMQLIGLFMTTNIYVARHDTTASLEQRVLRSQQELEADAPHAHVCAAEVLRELRKDALSRAGIELPVIFTSLVSSGFFSPAAAPTWQLRDIMNTTPNVALDHQTFELDGELHYRWYLPDTLHRTGTIQALCAAYAERLIQAAQALTVPPPQRVAEAPPAGAKFLLTNQQTAYAFGRLVYSGASSAGCALHLEFDREALQTDRLERAWNALVQHHPMLRCSILSSGQQQIRESGPEYRIESVGQAETQEEFERLCQTARKDLLAHTYPLDSYPYFALKTCSLGTQKTRVFINIDLVIADAPSTLLLASQLFSQYAEPGARLPVSSYTFRDYLAFRNHQKRSAEYTRQRTYWENKFATLPCGPTLPCPSAATTAEKHHLYDTLPYLRPLRERAERLGVELEALLLAAYGQILWKYNGRTACSVVVACWDRDSAFSGLDALVGDFTRLSWVSFDRLPEDVDVAIRQVQAQLDADAAHRMVDGIEVLRTRKGLSFPAVFTKMVPALATSEPSPERLVPVHSVSQTPQVGVDNITRITSETQLSVQWDSILGDRTQESEMFERYCDTLRAWAGVPRTQPERVGCPQLPASGVVLHELFERIAAEHGELCAVRFEGAELSYQELEQRSRGCARWLLAQGIGPDDVVAVFMERSPELVVALLGILRAGAAYLPLDVAAPQGRLEKIVADAGVRCLLTQQRLAQRWDATPRRPVLGCVDELDFRSLPTQPATLGLAGERNLAYVIYTSGSTGTPKGCMIEHRSIVNRLAWMQAQFPLQPGDAVLQKTPYSFDVSVWEFFWPLIVGATVVLAKPGGHLDAAYLLDLIARERISVCHFVPSMLRLMLEEPKAEQLSGLQRVIVSGEALDYDLLERFVDRVRIPLENLYGPTEAAVDVSYWPAQRNAQRQTSLGKAISRVQLHVLNEQLEAVAVGEIGELYIGGIAVGRGYLGNPELTARSFIKAPSGSILYKTGDIASFRPDGNIAFHGRRDGQIKLNGLRIELTEIEHHLRNHDMVEDAMVTMEGGPGKEMLVAYIVQRDRSQKLAKEALRDFLRHHVSSYMIPHLWVPLQEIPLTPHGKRKRITLAEVGMSAQDAPAETGAPAGGAKSPRELIELLRGML